MANSKRTVRRKPLRRIKTNTDQPEIYQQWLGKSPRLKAALAEAERRFGDLPYVHGVGLGRKYRESEERGGTRPRSTLGLCVTIWVKEKVDVAQIPQSERIPKYLTVNVTDRDRPVRVMTDVVVVGDNDINDDDGEESGDNWPTAGDVRTGARHSCSLVAVESSSGRFAVGEAKLGTTGTMIEIGTSVYGTTAAHTIFPVSHGKHNVPSYPRGFGVKGRDWIRIQPSTFFPGSIRVGPHIRDALLFLVPNGLAATGDDVWPPDFHGRIATVEDITAAVDTDDLSGFVWVERDGERIKRSCSVWQGSGNFSRRKTRDLLQYSFVWMYKFRSYHDQHRTKGGDSGAGVFIPAANGNEYSLLGLHFFRKNDVAYAVDADNFLRAAVGVPNIDFTFAGLAKS